MINTAIGRRHVVFMVYAAASAGADKRASEYAYGETVRPQLPAPFWGYTAEKTCKLYVVCKSVHQSK